MDVDLIGPPQIAAALVLIQRGAEQIYVSYNTRRLIAAGGREEGKSFYPVVVVTHLAWLASVFFLIPANATIVWPALALFLLLQVCRYWVIGTLGRYWTYRIITLDDAPLVATGPYRLMRHPNYAVSYAETFFLPLAFGAIPLAVIMTAIYVAVTRYKIVLEERALAGRQCESAATEG